jgi:Tfp pilus assembly protein PilV
VKRRKDSRAGYILLEATVAYVVLALALVSLLPLFILSIRANGASGRIAVAVHLSSELLEEISARRWDEKSGAPPRIVSAKSPLGLDPGDRSGDKSSFNDMDDFSGWSESPPQDPSGRPLPELSAYSRSVTVSFVDEAFKPSPSPTDFKKVTVCTGFSSSVPICLERVFFNR